MRILIAEDERITRASLARTLEGWGHQVAVAEDGEQAWERLDAGEFDLVMTDWEMPRLSGVDLIRRIRAKKDAPYVYLLMLTSRSDKSDLVSGIEAGADDFVSKPFNKDELRARLLAGERVVRLERTLSAQNDELRAATERIRRDLDAAAHVQRAMLPKANVIHPRVRTAFSYVPTDELAGDALGFCLIDDRYLVAYVLDVSGHGVPAALLAVTVMHAMSPTGEGSSLLLAAISEGGGVQRPSRVIAELNRRFCAGNIAGRFLTMILCVLDTRDGLLRFCRAGHPLPVVVRGNTCVRVSDEGGMPLGVLDIAEFEDAEILLQPGDRVCLCSDGIAEQRSMTTGEQFGEPRFNELAATNQGLVGTELVDQVVIALKAWAGGRSFADDVSLLVIDWLPA